MKNRNPKKENIKLRKNMSIGAMDASEDLKFLKKCFVDTGDKDLLTDTSESKCIVLGRTGSGKSALLEIINSEEENSIVLLPQELCLNYIANSTIIRFFEGIGIKLDIFYQLLWRHMLVVELIKKKFNIENEEAEKTFFDNIRDIFDRDKKKKEAVDYLMKWGNKFWLETDERIKEITTNLEKELSSSADFKTLGMPLTISGYEKLSTEQKEDITYRAQNVVNGVQIQKLNKVIKLLADDIFTDPQQEYFILIDKLDDDWVEDELRYRLIRALIETIKTFKNITPVKIIVSLRIDLLSRVFEHTRDSGFQEEKYDDLILKLKWSKDELKEILDKRVGLLFREHYTKNGAMFNSIFKSKVNGKNSLDYILKRTFMRPRDAISFTNLCLEQGLGKTEITATDIKSAEKYYSKKRFDALCHEWHVHFPYLINYCDIIKNKKNGFKHSDILDEDIDELILTLFEKDEKPIDPIKQIADKMFEQKSSSYTKMRYAILKILYRIGILGIKKATYHTVSWSHDDEPLITDSEIKNASQFEIHPMLHSVFGIHDMHKN